MKQCRNTVSATLGMYEFKVDIFENGEKIRSPPVPT